MQFFLNELTLQEQYLNGREFEDAIRCLLLIFKKIEEMDNPKEVLSHKTKLIGFKPLAGKFFHDSLKEVNKDHREQFKKIIFQTTHDWRTHQRHAINDSFMLGPDNVTDTSMAEFAERKLIDDTLPGALLNFIRSSLAGQQMISLIKNGNTKIDLACFENDETLSAWAKQYSTANTYDPASSDCPTDNQTVLRESRRFVRTVKVEQGRRVYREKETGYYWYVDNFHCGHGAHLEVFDQYGIHIGQADLSGNIDHNKRDSGRTLN